MKQFISDLLKIFFILIAFPSEKKQVSVIRLFLTILYIMAIEFDD